MLRCTKDPSHKEFTASTIEHSGHVFDEHGDVVCECSNWDYSLEVVGDYTCSICGEAAVEVE